MKISGGSGELLEQLGATTRSATPAMRVPVMYSRAGVTIGHHATHRAWISASMTTILVATGSTRARRPSKPSGQTSYASRHLVKKYCFFTFLQSTFVAPLNVT
jgi:hypothetical protein